MLWQRRRRGALGGAHERFQERIAQVRARPWKVTAVVAGFLAVLAMTVWLLGFSTAFVVEEVEVTGAGKTLREDVEAAAAVPMGEPMARVSTAGVAERVLQDLRVAEVDVGRSWPSTVTIEVTPRKPALAVSQPGQDLQLADATGVVYRTVSSRPDGVPRVTVRQEETEPEQLVGVLDAHAALQDVLPRGAARQVGRLEVTRTGDLQLSIGNLDVVWGDPERHQLKATVVRALLRNEHIGPNRPETETDQWGVEQPVEPMVIDVRDPETPTVTGLPAAPEDEES